jgi:hypothetical protein
MSMQRRCDVWKATDGQWYMLLGKFEHAEEEGDCDTFGPFSSEEAVLSYLRKSHSNPGGYSGDDSGTQPPPKKITTPRRVRHLW